MRRLIASIAIGLMMLSPVAQAQHRGPHGHHGHHGHHGYHSGWGWIAPALIGGAVVYAATRPTPVVVQEPVIVTPPQPVVLQQPPVGYHWEQILDARCNCNRVVLVPN